MKSKILLLTRVFWLIAITTIAGLNGAKAQTYVSIGTGSLVNTGISYPAPYGNFFYGARHQFLILASELTTAGVSPNSIISQIGFNVQTPAPQPLQNLTMRMTSTAATTLTTTFIEAGLVSMFDPVTWTNTPGWNTHTFTNGGYVWDGTSNLLVDICFNNTSWTTNALSYYSTTTTARASYRYADAQGNCIDPGFQTATNRPNMRLTIGGVNLPPPIAPLANFQFTLGVDTLWERSPSIITNTSTYQDKSYWDITGYNDDSTNGVWDPFYTVRQPNTWGTWIDTVANAKNFNFKFPVKGFYRVKLLTVNLFGVSTIEKVVYVALPTVKPRAYFFASKTLAGEGDQIQMYDASSNGPIGWSWWLDPPCISCGQFINEFFPSNDLPRPALNANEGGTYSVCMAVWNDIGGDTVCRKNYVTIIDGFTVCIDSVSKAPSAYLHSSFFPTYTTLYYAAQNCPTGVPGFRIAPCADTIFINLERLKLRSQDSVLVIKGSFNGTVLRRWGGNNLGALPDSSKNFKFVGQELFVKFIAGTPNTPAPLYVNDSGFMMKWSIAPATFPAPSTSFTTLDTVYSGYKMTMNNTTPGTNIAFAWDLNGDGNYGLDNPIFPDSTTTNPTYTFFTFTPVTKNICLRARNCQGASTKCKPVYVLPIARAPIADFIADKTYGFTTDTFKFTDISQYGSSSWSWTFSPNQVTFLNGTSAVSQNPQVSFNVAQAYDVTLQATNPFGSTTITKTAYVTTIGYSNPASVYNPLPSDVDIGITRVRLNGTAGKIDTITPLKDGAYHSYYLSSQAVVYRGASYKVIVNRETTNDLERARIWIDFNRNTTYGDNANEIIYSKDSLRLAQIEATFTVPNDAGMGLTRMLIGKCTDYSTITPQLATLGVYEDHGLIVAQDFTKPVVFLKGNAIHKTQYNPNQPYVDPGDSAWDNIEGDISSRVVMLGTVDRTKVGYYKLRYYVVDNYGNVSDTVYRLVQVEVSTVPPNLTLLGSKNVSMQVYNRFNETGYTAFDNTNQDISAYVVRGGNLDTAHVGTYTVTYSVSDAFNNKAFDTRSVTVFDTVRPVIASRTGSSTIIHEIKTAFEDNDYIKVTDNYYTNVPYSRSGPLNINKRGTYTLYYNAVDGSGNIAVEYPLNVVVKSTQPPTIVLNNEADILLNVFDTYYEYGATAKDYDGNDLPVVIGQAPNTSKIGDYTVTYTATDLDGNIAQITRSVRVRDTEAPKITLLGKDPYYITIGTVLSKATDPGYKVNDNYYDENSLIIRVNYDGVKTNVLGTYTATYDASDPSGNVAAQKQRIFIVVASTNTGLAEKMNTDGYAIYPNPANNVLNIDLKKGDITGLTVYDIQGKGSEVKPESLGGNQYRLDLGGMSSGLYLIRIETADGKVINSKFTIAK